MTLLYEFKTNMKRKTTLYRVVFQLKAISQEKYWPFNPKFALRETRMEKNVSGTLCFCFLFRSSRNTLHTDQVALAIHSERHPTIVNAQVLHNVNASK